MAGLPGTRDADTAQNVAASEALADTFEKERRALLRVRLVTELAETLVAGGDGEAEAGVEETAGVDLVKAVQLVRLVRAHGGSTSWKKQVIIVTLCEMQVRKNSLGINFNIQTNLVLPTQTLKKYYK